MRKLASAVAKREGKRSQTSIGNVRETLKVLIEVLAEDMANCVDVPPALNGEWDKAMHKAILKATKKIEKGSSK